MGSFLSYGSGKALSYQHDFGKDIDRLYQREAYKMQVQAQKEQKSAYYASMMKQHTAAAEFNKGRLDEFYLDLTNQVADYSLKHPNWESDVMQSQEMYSLMDKFINNDIVREDLQVQAEWEKVKTAYSNQQLTESEYQQNAERYDKYKKEGGDPFVFANPKRKEMPDLLKEINTQLAGATTEYTDKATGKIYRTTKTSGEDIHLAVLSAMSDPENRRAIETSYNAIPEKERAMFSSVIDYAEKLVAGGEEYQSLIAGYDELYMYNAKKSVDQNLYNRHYMTNVYKPLGESGSVQPHEALMSFGSWPTAGNVMAFGAQGKTFKAFGKDGNPSNLTIKGSTKGVGSAGMKMIGGVPFVGTTVQVMIDPNEDSLDNPDAPDAEKNLNANESRKERKRREEQAFAKAAEKRKMIDDLETNGFVMKSVYEEGFMQGMNSTTKKGSYYEGTVWEPANFTEAARKQYDISFGGSGKEVTDNMQAYSDERNIFEAVQTGNIPVLNALLSWSEPEDDGNKYAEYTVPGTNKKFIFSMSPQGETEVRAIE